MERTNCKNCGAPIQLNADKCPYCHTPYNINSSFGKNGIGKLIWDGEEIECYISNVETHFIVDSCRDITGRYTENSRKAIRKITLVEV